MGTGYNDVANPFPRFLPESNIIRVPCEIALGTVAAVSGALVATSLVYTLPATMFAQMLAAKGAALTRDERLELVGARALAALGVVLAGIGVWAAF